MTRFFFGRKEERHRLESLTVEPVAVIYGLPGIGKTELAYQASAELREQPGWESTSITRIVVEPHHAPIFASFLFAHLTGRGGDRAQLVQLLVRHRHLIVLDNAHHAAEAVATVIDDFLRETGQASRMIVTSRSTLPLVTTPIVIRVGPLSKQETRELGEHFASRLGVRVEVLDELLARSGGSPLLLRHLLAGARRGAVSDDPIHQTIELLDQPARDALVRLAAVAGCSRSRLAASRLVPDDRVFNQLAEQFLVESGPEELVVHELVREMAMANASEVTVASSRRTAAGVLWEDFERHSLPLLAVESICLSVSAGDIDQAFASLRGAIQSISGAGLDYLLVPTLEHLAATRPDARLALARIYLRMSRINDAAHTIDSLPAIFDRNLSVLVTRATIAERRCQLVEARLHLETALEVAPSARVRGLLSMRVAIVDALAGESGSAFARMEALDNDPALVLDSDRVRRSWARGVLHALQLEWNETITVVTEGRRLAQHAALVDLDFLLLLLELFATCELGDLRRAGELATEARTSVPNAHLRGRMLKLYIGISSMACGRIDEAVATLERASAEYQQQEDELLACLAKHFLGRALGFRGDFVRSIDVLFQVSERARGTQLVPLIGPGLTHLARALISVGRIADAEKLALGLVGDPNVATRAEAQALLAYVHGFRGEVTLARRAIGLAILAVGDREPGRTQYSLDEAYLELFGGDPERARVLALAVLEDKQRCERPYVHGRALLIMAVADVAAGIYDSAVETLARVEEIANNHGLLFLHNRVALLRAATSHQGASILERVPVEQHAGYVGILRVLGLRAGTVIVSSRHGKLHTEQTRLKEISRDHDLLVDLTSGSIFERGGSSIEGRGVAAAILVALAESTEPVPPERLYQIVWGGSDYHPLRHRNTLYIALNRTRKLLDELLGGREVIVRRDCGWLISPEVDIAVARRDPRVSTVTQRGA